IFVLLRSRSWPLRAVCAQRPAKAFPPIVAPGGAPRHLLTFRKTADTNVHSPPCGNGRYYGKQALGSEIAGADRRKSPRPIRPLESRTPRTLRKLDVDTGVFPRERQSLSSALVDGTLAYSRTRRRPPCS